MLVSPRNPLRTYQFRVRVQSFTGGAAGDGYVAGVRSVSGLRTQIAPFEVWEGGNNLHRYANPNKVTWEPITLEQGIALDDTLEAWAQTVLNFVATGTVDLQRPVKREVIIDLWDENAYPAGPPTQSTSADLPSPAPVPNPPFERSTPLYRRYRIFNAWISKYQALPKLDSMTSEVALLSVELMHEGWTRADITA